jgi:hypothetical protein
MKFEQIFKVSKFLLTQDLSGQNVDFPQASHLVLLQKFCSQNVPL